MFNVYTAPLHSRIQSMELVNDFSCCVYIDASLI